MLSVCVTPASLYGTETLALTETRQQRLHVCENRRRVDELREEIGLRKSLRRRVVENRLKRAGHVERMAEDRLAKRALHTERKAGGEEGDSD